MLVRNRVFSEQLRRYGHIALPVVLILLGLHILSD
jgi:cadmium resistance protein CadD (predicted permease)